MLSFQKRLFSGDRTCKFFIARAFSKKFIGKARHFHGFLKGSLKCPCPAFHGRGLARLLVTNPFLCDGLFIAPYFGQDNIVNVDVYFPKFRLRVSQENTFNQVLHHNRHAARRVGLDEARNVTLLWIVPVLDPKPLLLVQENEDVLSAEFGTKKTCSP